MLKKGADETESTSHGFDKLTAGGFRSMAGTARTDSISSLQAGLREGALVSPKLSELTE